MLSYKRLFHYPLNPPSMQSLWPRDSDTRFRRSTPGMSDIGRFRALSCHTFVTVAQTDRNAGASSAEGF